MERFEARAALFKSLARYVSEVGIRGVTGGNVEAREGVGDLFEFDVAALRDLPGAIDRVLQFAEERHHFVARFQVEIGMVPVHAIGVGHGLPRLNAHEDFVRAGVFAAQIMRVVGGDQRDAGFDGEAIDLGDETLVLVEPMVLNFEKEVFLAEDVAVGVSEPAGVVVFFGENGFVEVAAQAGREADEAFGMCGEEILVDARLVVEAFQERRGNHLDQVFVAFLVLAEQDEMVVTVAVDARLESLLGNVHLATDDRMNPLRLRGVVEADRAEEVAMIGHGDSGHFLLCDDFHELIDFARAVEQRIIGVVVEVNEGGLGHRETAIQLSGETTTILLGPSRSQTVVSPLRPTRLTGNCNRPFCIPYYYRYWYCALGTIALSDA